ncbi:hypothetical protein JCM15457_995 [Liquorilactobacillus sucicola DSM 21376 = JCM 15457]|uniref:Integral membrane protein n=1 Tax=Liquorilactobacillus sucicola DSM 21376 = JCM 15457 TaxID=1423806 RepID=A0A023CW91_9LACO|nr:hypothetical protein [Liquorilactobacillus sucicola]KRN06158.1 hypothetical protein FD15_GL001354 [Liquorilactobacillus sucicola DSM 21376 = JCM 15457]GAJ26084.1 hypothetical protein JCM15457_995 [Liquorilactobacillus sucicola DSM 21376 = JCM 15457]
MNIVNILTLFLTGIIFFLGYYLYTHHHKTFLMFHPENNHALSVIVRIYGILLLVAALATFLTGFFFATWILAVVLIIDVIVIATLPIMLLIFLQ